MSRAKAPRRYRQLTPSPPGPSLRPGGPGIPAPLVERDRDSCQSRDASANAAAAVLATASPGTRVTSRHRASPGTSVTSSRDDGMRSWHVIELDAVGRQFEPYLTTFLWCGLGCRSLNSRGLIKLRRSPSFFFSCGRGCARRRLGCGLEKAPASAAADRHLMQGPAQTSKQRAKASESRPTHWQPKLDVAARLAGQVR